jgi:hypothetical protein
MKIGIVLTGIANGKVDDTSGLNIPRSFKNCFDNIQEKLITPFTENYETKLYLTTYDMFDANEVIEAYKPLKHQLLPYKNSAEITTYIKSMEMLLDEDVDFIITTRFDLFFRSNVIDWNIKYNKFNVAFKEGNFKVPECLPNHFTDCSIFMFPKRYLKSFIIALKQTWQFNPQTYFRKNMHPVTFNFSKIMHKHSVHFLSNKYQISSEENSFFFLYRQKVDKYGLDYELPDFDLPQNLDDTMLKNNKTIDRLFL